MGCNEGAPASPSGSRPSDQAQLHGPDASRFDPSRGIWERLGDEDFRRRYTVDSVTEQLAAQLRMLRLSRGMTVAELAERIDCSTHDIELIESGTAETEIDLLLQIASVFDVALVARFVPFSDALALNGYIPSITEQASPVDPNERDET